MLMCNAIFLNVTTFDKCKKKKKKKHISFVMCSLENKKRKEVLGGKIGVWVI